MIQKIEKSKLTNVHSIISEIYSHFSRNSRYRNSFLYGVVRWLKPRTVIETGVHYGVSTAFILSALRRNGIGHLYSIDLPIHSYLLNRINIENHIRPLTLIPGWYPGFAVQDYLRKRWTLVLGDVRNVLPLLVKQLSEVDLFFRDSAHTYDIMQFEYETAWAALKYGGILISDDVDTSDAFRDFSIGRICNLIDKSKGFCIKTRC